MNLLTNANWQPHIINARNESATHLALQCGLKTTQSYF